MQNLHLILGCFGRRVDDFVSCPGVENTILNITPSINRYNDMMDYFDSCRLFDKPLLEFNAIRHFVYNLQDRYDQINKRLWTNQKFDLYQKFVIDHRHCGLIIRLEVPVKKPEPVNDDEVLNISSKKFKLIRGG